MAKEFIQNLKSRLRGLDSNARARKDPTTPGNTDETSDTF